MWVVVLLFGSSKTASESCSFLIHLQVPFDKFVGQNLFVLFHKVCWLTHTGYFFFFTSKCTSYFFIPPKKNLDLLLKFLSLISKYRSLDWNFISSPNFFAVVFFFFFFIWSCLFSIIVHWFVHFIRFVPPSRCSRTVYIFSHTVDTYDRGAWWDGRITSLKAMPTPEVHRLVGRHLWPVQFPISKSQEPPRLASRCVGSSRSLAHVRHKTSTFLLLLNFMLLSFCGFFLVDYYFHFVC